MSPAKETKKSKAKDDVVIELKNVWRTYVMGDTPVHALRGINLKVRKGEFVAIMGPSGSGKCLSGDALISLEDGTSVPISELENMDARILGLDKHLRIVPLQKSAFYSRVADELLDITLQGGQRIKLTPEHPLLTMKGWIPAEELSFGSYIATPAKNISMEEKRSNIECASTVVSGNQLLLTVDEQLLPIFLHSDIYWEKIVDVKRIIAKTIVYDITVPEFHNFIANNILVHNSTAMNMVGCLDIPSKGDVLLGGENISHMTESDLAQIRGRKIGFIFQKFNLINTLSAKENIMLPMIFQGIPEEKRHKKAQELLKLVDLEQRADHRPTELSGGQQQRVAIARALAVEPEVILADEPTGNLDSKTGASVMDFLKKLHKEGTTIIMVTHDEHIARNAERIEFLRDGEIIETRHTKS